MDRIAKVNRQGIIDFEKTEELFLPASKPKVLAMQTKMRTAFKYLKESHFRELKESQQKMHISSEQIKFTESELKRWKNNYLSLFNLGSVGYFTVYADLVVREANDAMMNILNCDLYSIIAQPITIYAKPESRDRLRQYFQSIFAGKSVSSEFTFISHQGKELPVVIHSVLTTQREDSSPCCLCSVSDLTELRQMESSLQDQQDSLKGLSEKHAQEISLLEISNKQKDQEYSSSKTDWESGKSNLQNLLTEQADQLGKVKQDIQEKISQLNQELETRQQAEYRIKGLELAKKALETQLEQSNNSQLDFSNQAQELQNQIEQKDIKISKLQGQLDKTSQSLKNQERQFQNQADEFNNASQDNDRLKGKYKKLKRQISNLTAEKMSAVSMLEGIKSEKNKLEAKILELEKQIAVHISQNNGYEKSQNQWHNQQKKLQELVDNQKEQIDRITGEMDVQLVDSRKQFKDLRELSDERIAELKGAKELLETKFEASYQAQQTLRSRCDEYESMVRLQTFELANLKSKIGGQEQTQACLDDLEQKNGTLEKNANIGTWQLDFETKEFAWSDQVYRIFGLKPQMVEIYHNNYIDSVCSEDKKAVKKLWSLLFSETASRDFSMEHKIEKLNGDISIVFITGQLNVDPNGNIILIQGTVCDVTVLRNTEKELNESHHALEQIICDNVVRINHITTELKTKTQENKKLSQRFNRMRDQFRSSIERRTEELEKLNIRLKENAQQSDSAQQQLREQLADTQRTLGSQNKQLSIINSKLHEQVSQVRLEKQQQTNANKQIDKLLKQTQAELKATGVELENQKNGYQDKLSQRQIEHQDTLNELADKTSEMQLVLEAYNQRQGDYNVLKLKLGKARAKLKKAAEKIKNQRLLHNKLRHSLSVSKVLLEKLCELGAITMNVYNISQRKTIYVNRHIGTSLGYTEQQIEQFGNEIISKLMHPQDYLRIQKDLRSFSWENSDEVLGVEYRVKDVNSKWRYIFSQEIILSRDENDKPNEILAVQFDYTDKVQVKKGLAALHQIVDIVKTPGMEELQSIEKALQS